MPLKHFVGEVGTIFRLVLVDELGTVINISDATTKQIKFTAPDDTEATQTAVFTDDGSDGEIEYVTEAGDLDQAGRWKYQAKVIGPSYTYYGEVLAFRVFAVL